MRISVPTIPHAPFTPAGTLRISRAAAVERMAEFLAPGNVTLLSGAGVSVDSGIRAYRGKDGRYMNPNYKPIFYHELVDETPKGYAFRQRYWLRSYLGYPPVRDALPNTTHYALAALQYTSHIRRIVTQNVDGLHSKALSSVLQPASRKEEEHLSRILELHGTLHKVSCKHGHVVDRNTFQTWLAHSNPRWARFMDDLERTGQKLRTNPDGDVELPGASYDDFVVPDCPACLRENRRVNMHKPHLIFFGESISKEVKEESIRAVEESDRLFIVGTTLATYSAFRLLKRAIELHKPVLMLNVGPTRADSLTLTTSTEPRGVGVGMGATVMEKIELPSGSVLREVVRRVTGFRHLEDSVLAKFLTSGVVQPPTDPTESRAGTGESEDRHQEDGDDDSVRTCTRPPKAAAV